MYSKSFIAGAVQRLVYSEKAKGSLALGIDIGL